MHRSKKTYQVYGITADIMCHSNCWAATRNLSQCDHVVRLRTFTPKSRRKMDQYFETVYGEGLEMVDGEGGVGGVGVHLHAVLPTGVLPPPDQHHVLGHPGVWS